ncbi:MAG: efflux transporter outer membrane subunit [Sphingobium sp.]
MTRAPILALIPALLLSGCTMAPRYERPAMSVAPTWPGGEAYAPAAEEKAGLPWTSLVTDAKLKAVIEQALANNRDLRAALANVLSARAEYKVQRAAQLPAISGDAAASIARTADSYSADIGISAFEIDLFGRVKNLSRAALESYLATEEGARSTRITLVAETATAYATLAADRELLALAERTAVSAERSLAATRALASSGLAAGVDVHQAETVLEQARSDIASNRTQVAQDRNALNLLAGAPVEEALLPASLADLDAGLARVPAGLRSDILLQRPDVLQAEHQLKAANANIGAARAALFPKISLTSVIGVASSALSSLFKGGAFTWSAQPSASLPIFGGSGKGNLAYSEAQRDLYLAQYEKAIQTAFQEVADTLARAGTMDAQQAAQRALVAASGKAYAAADQRYRAGIDTFLNSLTSQRTYYGAQQTAIATELAAVGNRISMYRVIAADF